MISILLPSIQENSVVAEGLPACLGNHPQETDICNHLCIPVVHLYGINFHTHCLYQEDGNDEVPMASDTIPVEETVYIA